MNLYEITAEMQHLIRDLEECPTDEAPLIVDKIEQLEVARDRKLEGIAAYLKNSKYVEDNLDNAIKDLRAKQEALHNKTERLKYYVLQCLNGRNWTNGVHSLGHRMSSRVIVDDETMVPAEYKNIVTQTTVNKIMLKEALKSGLSIDGVKLQDFVHVTVK